MKDDLIEIAVGRYQDNILGIPGLWFDDGRVQLFCGSREQRLLLPAPAGEILTDIAARQAAREPIGPT